MEYLNGVKLDFLEPVFGKKMSPFYQDLDRKIVGWANPLAADSSVRICAKNNWIFNRLDHALALAGCYLLFVLAMRVMFYTKSNAKEEKKQLGVWEKFTSGPIVFLLMVVYNATQVALCGWMVKQALVEREKLQAGWICLPHDLSNRGIAAVSYVFYLSKVLDFADTFFMIIKGNWNQVTFLHVYHHFSIFLVYWLNNQAAYNGDLYYTIVLNGAIHFIMYGYYLVTTFNIPVPQAIKMFITKSQIIQFCAMIGQGSYMLYFNCPYPRNVVILYIVYICTMLLLFTNFYSKSYQKSDKAKKKHT